jgi:hypothetical protein
MSLTVLQRQEFLPILGLVFVWLWFARPGRRREVLRGACYSIIVVFLAIIPWTIRNYLVFHEFVLLNTNAGYVFYWSNNPIHGTNFIKLFPTETYIGLIPQELRSLNEAALEKALMRRGIQFVMDDPARFLRLSQQPVESRIFWVIPSLYDLWDLAIH